MADTSKVDPPPPPSPKNSSLMSQLTENSARGQAIVGRESCGDYILMDIIGKGGFGVVYKGLHKSHGYFAAIKKIRVTRKKKKDAAQQAETQSSLMAEINLLTVLEHHNIVRYYDHIPTSSHSYIIMEFIENGSLEKLIKKYGLLPESLIGVYISQVLSGLAYLHRQGVIHRDIKAANLLISTDGSIKLADFGVATKVSDLSADNPDDSFAGTPYWMAPEVIQMQGVSTACDIWSLGCTIIELLTGAPPYFGLAPASALFKIVQEDHPPIPQGISSALQDFLLQCFKKDENMRSTAKQLLIHPWLKSIQIRNPESQVKNARAEILSYNAQLHEAISTPTPVSIETRPRSRINHPPPLNQHHESGQLSSSPGASGVGALNLSSSSIKQVEWVQPNQGHVPTQPIGITGKTASIDKSKVQLGSPRGTPSFNKLSPSPSNISSSHSTPQISSTNTNRPSSPLALNISSIKDKPQTAQIVSPRNNQANNQANNTNSINTASGGESGSSSPLVAGNKLKLPKLNKFIERDEEEDDSFFESSNSLLPSFKQANDANDWKDEFDGFSDDEEEKQEKLKLQEQEKQRKRSIKLVKKDEEWNSEIEDSFDSFAMSESESQRTLNIHDKYKEQVIRTIIELITNLASSTSNDSLILTSNSLIDLFQSYPEERRLMITNGEFGVYYRLPIISILDILENNLEQLNNSAIFSLLKLINQCIIKEKNVQEIVCLMNGIPIITHFAKRVSYPDNIREEVSKFVLQLCSSSTFNLNMLITGSRGCKVLVELLDSDYFTGFPLIHNSLDSISLIFKMNTPRTALCHLFARTQLMYRIGFLLNQIFNNGESDTPQQSISKKKVKYPTLSKSSSMQNLSKDQFDKVLAYSVKAADILLFFSSTGDSLVKEEMSQENVINNIVNVLNEIHTWRAIGQDVRSFLLKILKVIKNLSMESHLRAKLDASNVIPALINFLKFNNSPGQHPHLIERVTEIYNQCINALYYLLLLDRQRQEKALKYGMLPPLLFLINERGPLKELAMPMLFDFVRNSTERTILWDCNTLDILLDIIQDRNWFADAIEAIAAWASIEPNQIFEKLVNTSKSSSRLIFIFDINHAKHPSFPKSLTPLLSLINAASQPLLKSLIEQGKIISSLIECLKLDYNSPFSKITLLKITVSIVTFITNNNNNNNNLIDKKQSETLYQTLQSISEKDESEIVKKIADQLLLDLKSIN